MWLTREAIVRYLKSMWRLIKWLVFAAMIIGIFLWVTGYKVRGRTIQEHLGPLMESKAMKEGVRDIRALVGEGFKAVGDMISEDVTDSERKQLEDVLRRELDAGKSIEGAAGQKALPPIMPEKQVTQGAQGAAQETQNSAQAGKEAKSNLSKMVDQMLKDKPAKQVEPKK